MEEKGRSFFLLSFKFNGVKNINKQIEIHFYKNTISNSFKKEGYKVKGIYGENGVGKSAIITAMKIYKELMINKRYLRNETTDKKLAYIINKLEEKATFETEYLVKKDDNISIYHFVIQIQKNSKSQLYEIVCDLCESRKVNSRYRLLYKNDNGKLDVHIDKAFDNVAIDKSKNLLKESSFLSIMLNENFETTNNSTIDIFETMLLCHLNTYVYLDDKDRHNDYIQYQILNDQIINKEITDNVVFNNSIDYLTCNGNIYVKREDIESFRNEISAAERFIKVFKSDLSRIRIDTKEDKDSYACELVFEYEGYGVNGEFESTGIKKLIELYTAFKRVDSGQIVFIDELDANIHDYYLCKLLEYVAEYADGQLCFTTHNLGPMRVLKNYKKSIDFLSRNGELVSWTKNGNYQVDNLYSKGLISKSPFNLEAFRFLEVFGNLWFLNS